MKIKLILAVSALLAAVAFAGSSPQAAQASVSPLACKISAVQYDNGRLALWCSNDTTNIFYGFQSASGCVNQNIDTLKVWSSLAQGGLLSGRAVNLYFAQPSSTCGVPQITAMQAL
jgi:hypothetical protein